MVVRMCRKCRPKIEQCLEEFEDMGVKAWLEELVESVQRVSCISLNPQ